MGSVLVPDELRRGELAAFNSTSAAIEFKAQTAAEFVVGSAVPHGYDLVLGSRSARASVKAPTRPANMASAFSSCAASERPGAIPDSIATVDRDR
jgi:hypothetical protein